MKNDCKKILLSFFVTALTFFSTKGQTQELRTLFLEQINLTPHWTTIFDGGYYLGLGNADYNRWGIRNSTRYRLNATFILDAGFMYNCVDKNEVGIENEFRPHVSVSALTYKKMPIKFEWHFYDLYVF